MSKTIEKTPKILGLDVSTKTIGWALFDIASKELLELTHISPVVKPKEDNKIKELFLKTEIFKTKLEQYKGLGITKVVIEEEKFRWSDIKTFNKSFWIICLSCVLIYMAIFPFIQVASSML